MPGLGRFAARKKQSSQNQSQSQPTLQSQTNLGSEDATPGQNALSESSTPSNDLSAQPHAQSSQQQQQQQQIQTPMKESSIDLNSNSTHNEMNEDSNMFASFGMNMGAGAGPMTPSGVMSSSGASAFENFSMDYQHFGHEVDPDGADLENNSQNHDNGLGDGHGHGFGGFGFDMDSGPLDNGLGAGHGAIGASSGVGVGENDPDHNGKDLDGINKRDGMSGRPSNSVISRFRKNKSNENQRNDAVTGVCADVDADETTAAAEMSPDTAMVETNEEARRNPDKTVDVADMSPDTAIQGTNEFQSAGDETMAVAKMSPDTAMVEANESQNDADETMAVQEMLPDTAMVETNESQNYADETVAVQDISPDTTMVETNESQSDLSECVKHTSPTVVDTSTHTVSNPKGPIALENQSESNDVENPSSHVVDIAGVGVSTGVGVGTGQKEQSSVLQNRDLTSLNKTRNVRDDHPISSSHKSKTPSSHLDNSKSTSGNSSCAASSPVNTNMNVDMTPVARVHNSTADVSDPSTTLQKSKVIEISKNLAEFRPPNQQGTKLSNSDPESYKCTSSNNASKMNRVLPNKNRVVGNKSSTSNLSLSSDKKVPSPRVPPNVRPVVHGSRNPATLRGNAPSADKSPHANVVEKTRRVNPIKPSQTENGRAGFDSSRNQSLDGVPKYMPQNNSSMIRTARRNNNTPNDRVINTPSARDMRIENTKSKKGTPLGRGIHLQRTVQTTIAPCGGANYAATMNPVTPSPPPPGGRSRLSNQANSQNSQRVLHQKSNKSQIPVLCQRQQNDQLQIFENNSAPAPMPKRVIPALKRHPNANNAAAKIDSIAPDFKSPLAASRRPATITNQEKSFDDLVVSFQKYLVESADIWDRCDTDLVELRLNLCISESKALGLHGEYDDLLDEVEEMLDDI